MRRAFVFYLDGDSVPWYAIEDKGEPFSVRVGRGGESDLVIPESVPTDIRETASRLHARVFYRDNAIWVEDLGSNNFTFVNERMILTPTRISLPATLRLGGVVVRLRHERLKGPMAEIDGLPFECRDDLSFDETVTQGLSANVREEILGELRKRLHWTGALLELAELVSEVRRADDAEQSLRRIMRRHTQTDRVTVVLGAPLEGLPEVFDRQGLSRQAAKTIRQRLGVARDEVHFTRISIPEHQVLCWAVKPLLGSKTVYSIVAAQYASSGYPRKPTDELDAAVALTLRAAEPFIHTLRELERYRADELESVSHRPSATMLQACREAQFWGDSESFQRCLYSAEQAATRYLQSQSVSGKLPALFFLGETGTGKSVLARIVNRLSGRPDSNFVQINCATIPLGLAESELFGYEKGAHDRAFGAKPGLFETAANGTLFLDEIGKTSPELQGKLLTVLETGEYRRLGSTRLRRADCNVILAASEDPARLCKAGELLEELWFRIGAFTITLPPLRERPGDVALIVEKTQERLNNALPTDERKRISPEALALLQTYPWRGNVRELVQCLEVCYSLAPPEVQQIGPDYLPEQILKGLGIGGGAVVTGMPAIDLRQGLDENVKRLEREYLARLFGECGGNLSEVARRSGKAYQTIHTKMKELRHWLDRAEEQPIHAEAFRLRQFIDEHRPPRE